METKRKRMVGTDYDSFMDEFMDAAIRVFPDVLIQFEDFANHNAQRLLDRYRNDYCTFNDDIQGTASVVLAGLFSAMKLLGTDLSEHRFLFYGAGSAATGIGDLIIHVLKDLGYSDEEARHGIYLFDSKGLVTTNRDDLSEIKIPFARDCTFESDFDAAIETIKPTAIIGVSGMGGAFDQRVIQTMAELNDRPIIFALSNPTSKSECSAQQAYEWTNGKAIFASGSPFDPVSIDGKQFIPGQGNNAYIFPGLGFGAVISKPKQIQDDLFISAAETLASMVSNEDLKNGLLYPPLNQIREISIQIATNVAQKVFGMNGNESQPIDSIENTIREQTFCCGGGSGLNTDEFMDARMRGGFPRANAVRHVQENHDVNALVCICAIDRATLPPLMKYWVPEVSVYGLHELVGNALVMEGEEERTEDLREDEMLEIEEEDE